MNKTTSWICAALVCLLLPACDREQGAQMILTLAVAAHGRTSDVVLAKTIDDRDAQNAFVSLDRAVAGLHELERRKTTGPQPTTTEVRSAIQLIQDLQQTISSLPQTSEKERQQLQFVTFRALEIGARLVPEAFAEKRSAFQAKEFGDAEPEFDPAEASAHQFLNEYLAASDLSPRAGKTLNVHATAFPHCPTNRVMYETLVERLANEKKIGDAVIVARDGIERCRGESDARELRDMLNRILANNPGYPGTPMDLVGPVLNGTVWDAKQHHGRIVVVTFWATWCEACRQEVPKLEMLRDLYKKEGVEFVAVNMDIDRSYFAEYVRTNSIGSKQLYAPANIPSGWDNPVAKFYRVETIPSTFVIGRDGLIASRDLRGEADIESAIMDLLAADR